MKPRCAVLLILAAGVFGAAQAQPIQDASVDELVQQLAPPKPVTGGSESFGAKLLSIQETP